MTEGKFHALAARLVNKRQENLQGQRPLPHYEPVLDNCEESGVRLSSQLSLTFEELSPVLEIYQRFDSRDREIEWSVYGGNGEFLLQFGCKIDQGSYEIHSMHPELLQPGKRMQLYLEELNRRLANLYPALKIVRKEGGEPLLKRQG